MSHAYVQIRLSIARREVEVWENILRNKSCRDCENFQEGGCKLANGFEPPPEVQKVGCDSWSWDFIPF